MLVSGMIIGSVFTLFVVPSIYVLVARRRFPQASPETGSQREIGPSSPLLLPAPAQQSMATEG
jgi:hypothetical protein